MKRQTEFVIFFLAIIMTIAKTAIGTASPSLNAKCNHTVVQPTNASSLFFDESCNIIYVMPPIKGKAEINSLARTTNLQFCPSIKNVHTTVARISSSIDKISEKVEAMIVDFDPLDQEITNLRTELALSKINMETASTRLGIAETKRQEVKQTVIQARKLYEDCLDTYSTDHNLCMEALAEWQQAKSEIKEISREYRELSEHVLNATETYNRANAKMKEASTRYKEAVVPMFDLLERLSELKHKKMDLYREFAKLEGATGQIIWSIEWDSLLDDYRKLNPNLNVHWTRMPIKEAELIATAKVTTTNVSELTPIITAHIPGAKRSGLAGIGGGKKVNNAQVQPSLDEGAATVFGNSVSGQIVLNLLGACPYFEGINERTSIGLEELTNHMVANLIYTYEVAARRGYASSYNLSNLLTKIEEKSKEGGFFSTNHAHSLIEDQNSSDWFTIDFSNNTADFQYSVDEQLQITKSVKTELLDKAYKQFAVLNAGASVPPPIPQYVETGASASARGLRQCWHYYCQAGSIVLGIFDSIWGNSQAASSFHGNNGSWAHEKINGIQFVERSGSLAFKQ